MKIYRPYRFRIYPSDVQVDIIKKNFACARYVYNWYLNKLSIESTGIFTYKRVFNCINDLPKLISEKVWLKEVDISILIASLYDLMDSFKRCESFQTSMPNYKRKYSKNSYRITRSSDGKKDDINSRIKINYDKKTLSLIGLGEIVYRGYRKVDKVDGRIIHATVVMDNDSKFYVSISFEQEIDDVKNNSSTIIGIDLGITTFITTSHGEKYENIRVLKKYEDIIAKLNRNLSSKKFKSKNFYKAKRKLAIANMRIRNARKYYTHSLSKKFVMENDIIVCENLYSKPLQRGSFLAKQIGDASWFQFTNQLKYKSIWNQKQFLKINRFFPSSQLCNHCDTRNYDVKNLEVRKWTCKSCGLEHDRDINAAINIQFEGVKLFMEKL